MGIASVTSHALSPAQSRSPTAALQSSAALKAGQEAGIASAAAAGPGNTGGRTPQSVLNSLGQEIGQNLNVSA